MSLNLTVNPASIGPGENLNTENQYVAETKYTMDTVSIYQEPSTESAIVGTLPMNTPVEKAGEINEWSMLAANEEQSEYVYVQTAFLSDTLRPNRWNYAPTEEEKQLIYRIVMLESGAESDLGQQAVTEVIMNMTLYPDLGGRNIRRVLSKKNQYVTWKYVNSSRATPSQRVINNVDYVLSGRSNILPFQTIYFATYPQNRRVQARIGGHVFCNR